MNSPPRLFDRMIEEKWVTANGVIGFFPANAVGDDIELYRDGDRSDVLATLHNLRQQGEHREGVPNRSLGDFVAPKDSGLVDHIGLFAVTAGGEIAVQMTGSGGVPPGGVSAVALNVTVTGTKKIGTMLALQGPQAVDALAPLGIEHIDMPATPERVLKGLGVLPSDG